MQGTVVRIGARAGESVESGRAIIVLESMKMEHDILAPSGGVVSRLFVAEGATVNEGEKLFTLEASETIEAEAATEKVVDLDRIRDDLAEVVTRHDGTLDA